MTIAWKAGLEGVVAARTGLTQINGTDGRLSLCGYDMSTLAPAAEFEEMMHLLWHGELPAMDEYEHCCAELTQYRNLNSRDLQVLRAAAVRGLSPIEVLRLTLETVHLTRETESTAVALVAAAPTIVANYWRLSQGLDVIEPACDLGYAAAFLHMLHGERPTDVETRCLETYLNTMVDHGLNASTFTARVITSTRSDLRSAVVGALGALKGPIHGGAPEPVLEMLLQIGSAERAEPWLRRALARGSRIMGFGHREYRVRDPRAEILANAAAALAQDRADSTLYALGCAVEISATRLLDEAKPGRNLRTNAEFYTAILLHQLGIAPQLFSAVFAMSRIVGWIAHCCEQQRVDRIFRPTSEYVGPPARSWVAREQRA